MLMFSDRKTKKAGPTQKHRPATTPAAGLSRRRPMSHTSTEVTMVNSSGTIFTATTEPPAPEPGAQHEDAFGEAERDGEEHPDPEPRLGPHDRGGIFAWRPTPQGPGCS